MNLDLGILWIEDSFSVQEEDALKRRVQEAGFLARIDTIPNGIGIEELARKHQLFHSYDIILLDFRLQDASGAELAPSVRQMFPSTTVLFYSGSATEKELRQLIAKNEVEGVYCSTRDRFIERAGALIDQTARSLDRLSGMRGLAMRVVAECDALMKAAALSMSARDATCVSKLPKLDDDVLGFMTVMREDYEAATANDLEARLQTRAVDSAKLFKHFRRLTQVAVSQPAVFGLDEGAVERLRELRNISSQYVDSVLGKRNILGHVSEEKEATGWVLKGSDEIRVSDFGDLRRTFAVYIEAFRESCGLVTALDEQQSQ